jgi:hypothetical protein
LYAGPLKQRFYLHQLYFTFILSPSLLVVLIQFILQRQHIYNQ